MIKHISELVKRILSKVKQKSAERELFEVDTLFNTHYCRRQKELDYVLVARQAKSSFPNIICFGEQIKLLQCKTGRITKTEIEKMVRLIRAIIKIQPILVNIVYGEIKSREKTV